MPKRKPRKKVDATIKLRSSKGLDSGVVATMSDRLYEVDQRMYASATNLRVRADDHVPTPNVYVPSRQPSNCTPDASSAWDFTKEHGYRYPRPLFKKAKQR